MSVYPIEWHETTLATRKASLVRKYAELARLNAEIKRDEDEILFRQEQIDEAKRRGLAGFDNEKLLKKKAR